MQPKKRRKGAWQNWPMWVALGGALPILYVLSIGPAYWLFDHDLISGGTVRK